MAQSKANMGGGAMGGGAAAAPAAPAAPAGGGGGGGGVRSGGMMGGGAGGGAFRGGGGAVGAGPSVGVAPQAGWSGQRPGWSGGSRPGWHGHHRHHGRRFVGPGFGFGTGLLLGGAYAASPYYYDDYEPYYYDDAPAVVVGAGRSAEDEAYCRRRYRSYDPASGTYLSNDGNRYPCP
jgi:hypothetical protein